MGGHTNRGIVQLFIDAVGQCFHRLISF